MEHLRILHKLPDALLPWYRLNRRELPWRSDREPYHVWLSEIMLQQTRVEAVKGYYARFLSALPTVEALANCDDDVLHKLWEGLGYYSRVRNLKKAAQVIVNQHGGAFPGDYAAVRALPGIGDYTAGAICSICYDHPTPAVDGNVLRVISRILDDAAPIDLQATKKRVAADLAEIYPKDAGDFTQSLMELGATVCGPNKRPDCENCPCNAFCKGFQRGTAESLPVKSPKKERREEDLTVFILSCEGSVLLNQRPKKGLLAGLWEFPNLSGHLNEQEVLSAVESMGLRPRELLRMVERSHIFTHIRWNMRGYYIEVASAEENGDWFTREQVQLQAALPTAFRQFWEDKQDV